MREWLSIALFWIGGFGAGWLVCDTAHAAPLAAHGHRLDSQVVSVTVRLDLKVKRPQCVFVWTNSGVTYGGSDGYLFQKVCLHRGRNRVRWTLLAEAAHRATPVEPEYRSRRTVQQLVPDPCTNVVWVGVRRHSPHGPEMAGEAIAFEQDWGQGYACDYLHVPVDPYGCLRVWRPLCEDYGPVPDLPSGSPR